MGRRHRTEAEVLRQARRLFISKGYAGASVRHIADAAGVSVGTVASMGGKDALFLRCMEELATASALTALEAQSDPDRALRDFVRATPGLTEAGTQLSRDYLRALLQVGPETGGAAHRGTVVARLTLCWSQVLGLEPDAPEAAARAHAFYACLIGCVFAVVTGQLDRADAIKVVEGLLPAPAPQGSR